MNLLTKSFIFAVITGCSAAPSTTSSVIQNNAPNAIIPNWGVDQSVRFVSDLRPVDGNSEEIILTLDSRGYTATKHVVHGGLRPDPQPQDINEELATNLTCTNFFADEIGSLTGVSCSYDGRVVDGSLVEISATLEDGLYTLKKVVVGPGRGGSTEPVVTALGSDMTLVVDSDIPSALSCVDTATFSDGPGIQALIEINKDTNTASVTRTPVRLRGAEQEPSVLDENSYSVVSRKNADGSLSLSLTENVDTNVDWSSAGTCYKFFPTESFSMKKNADGTWTAGFRKLLPVTKMDPSVRMCNFPRLALPSPIEILCRTVSK